MILNSIRVSNLTKSYGADPIFELANMYIPAGNFAFLTGRSGSGKSTLLKMIHRLERIDSGEVSVGSFTPQTPLTRLRKNIGFIFQDYKLLEEQTAIENIMMPLTIRGIFYNRAKKMIESIAKECHVTHLLKQKICNLSGGEKQLIALVRAIITSPVLILADEPTANLDREAAEKVLHLLKKIHTRGTTIVLATHDLALIQSMKAQVFLIQDKKIKKVQAL